VSEGGHAIAQAVSRRLPTAAARVQTRIWSCGILWWAKVALGQVFSENLCFPCQSTFHLLLQDHLHYHPRLAQQARSGRIANSLTNQNKKKVSEGVRGRVVIWGTMLQGWRLRVRFPMPLDFFNLLNPSRRTVALGSTQSKREMGARNFLGRKGRPALKAENLAAIYDPIM
jgi:hypothetical protein